MSIKPPPLLLNTVVVAVVVAMVVAMVVIMVVTMVVAMVVAMVVVRTKSGWLIARHYHWSSSRVSRVSSRVVTVA